MRKSPQQKTKPKSLIPRRSTRKIPRSFLSITNSSAPEYGAIRTIQGVLVLK